ncbi:class I SAM-dependent DNA methyltransferase [Candidatus Bathycorpusculum sp.]|uniref:type I restriction-modification system subunit M n=1 Tax=Candidatus Bathycorpusculum sp. TaxID=2994959 RepID=UPI00281A1D66|nr:type I restriction-modification system subunit M [Candidatus Termitimicrobium sp.]MCL2432850.1 type I restriction-modification system subunit M [Candidatus Termitimicrobium sp.]
MESDKQTLKGRTVNGNGVNLGFEAKLWVAADKLRNNMDAAEYKHVVLGLIFLKYISDAFTEVYEELRLDQYADPEDLDEYRARNAFWVPPQSRWDYLQKNAKQPTIGKIVDDAMDLLERDNASLKGVLPKNYAREGLDKQRLGELVDLIGTIGLGDSESRSKDILGRVYEYFLGQFADAEGKKGGQFYTPQSIVRLLVAMLEPFRGRVYDPCCGSGGMFIQSEKFIQAHQDTKSPTNNKTRLYQEDLSIYGQESNQTTWRLCKMNLAIRHIDSKFVAWNNEGSFLNDAHKDLKTDYLLANPPFNDSDWKGEMLREDLRWKYGVPPVGNANFAWVQHFIHHLAPQGIAGFVLANGSMSSNTSNEGEIRKNIIEADLIDCMVALPSQLFYNTMIPACLWFIARNKHPNKYRNRRGETLFIDARNLGTMISRRHRELTLDDIKKVADTYHAWRGEPIENQTGAYRDVVGFCKAVKLEEIRNQGYILTPGRYVGIAEQEGDGEPFEEKMARLTVELSEMFKRSHELEGDIRQRLGAIGYDL